MASSAFAQDPAADLENAAEVYLEASQAWDAIEEAVQLRSARSALQVEIDINHEGDVDDLENPNWAWYLKERGEAMAAFTKAAAMRDCRFEFKQTSHGIEQSREFVALLRLGLLTEARAAIALQQGDSQAALRDLRTLIQASRHFVAQDAMLPFWVAQYLECYAYRLALRLLRTAPEADAFVRMEVERAMAELQQQPITPAHGFKVCVVDSKQRASWFLQNIPRGLSRRLSRKSRAELSESALTKVVTDELRLVWAPLLKDASTDMVKARALSESAIQDLIARSSKDLADWKAEENAWFPSDMTTDGALLAIGLAVTQQQLSILVPVLDAFVRNQALASACDKELAAGKAGTSK